MKQTDISVIIPAHNASDYIERAIKSIITQTDMSWEIIIVENGSTDDTYIKSMKYAEKYSNINIFQSEKGVSKARNYGLKKQQENGYVFWMQMIIFIQMLLMRFINIWKMNRI